jgi:hypothetical protein
MTRMTPMTRITPIRANLPHPLRSASKIVGACFLESFLTSSKDLFFINSWEEQDPSLGSLSLPKGGARSLP